MKGGVRVELKQGGTGQEGMVSTFPQLRKCLENSPSQIKIYEKHLLSATAHGMLFFIDLFKCRK